MDTRETLWTDTELYRRRYEKTATALIAVACALREARPLAGGEEEFLELYDFIASLDPEVFTEVWEDPSAYFWARRAYEITGASLGSEPLPAELENFCRAMGTHEPRIALAVHLEEFKKFVIGGVIIAGENRAFRHPLTTKLPFSIPGTEFSVLGSGSMAIREICGSVLTVEYHSRALRLDPSDLVRKADSPRIAKRPIARCGEYELLLKPESFYLPGISAGDALREVAPDFQKSQVDLIEKGLALVERHHPLAFGHLCEMVRLIALKPPASGDYSNVSYSDLPGAFILSAVQEPYWIADALIHELFHNRLFFIEEREALLTNAAADEGDARREFYSPWREDLRPLTGLLHAIYVYIAVSQFWFSVWRGRETSGALSAYVVDQAVRATLQVRIASRVLRRHALFSDFGKDLFREMEKEVNAAWTTLHTLGLSPDAPAMIARGDGRIVVGGANPKGLPLSIIETIREHARRYDSRGQLGDFDALLSAS
jgi:HEXXH motif-containing protein